MADRFYTPDSLGPGEYILAGADAHHLSTVRRFQPGDRVILFNGDGNQYPAEVIGAGKKSVALQILGVETPLREVPFPLVIAAALPKGDRADFLVEKLTELGATRFIPLVTARSVVQPKGSVVEKFTRAVVEASKQCGRNRLMVVDEPRKWDALLALGDLPATRVVLHTGAGLPSLNATCDGVVCAIGPEGGLTPEEVSRATNAEWLAASLGPRTLRVETAAVAAAAWYGLVAFGTRSA